MPTDIPDFYQGGDMGGGFVFTGVGESLLVEGGCTVAFSNETDYSLMETNTQIITDTQGRETHYGFRFCGRGDIEKRI